VARLKPVDFVDAKLQERDQRHDRQGATRYVVEPNIKEGKGGTSRSSHAVLDREIRLSRRQHHRHCRQGHSARKRGAPLCRRAALPVDLSDAIFISARADPRSGWISMPRWRSPR
jgi:hypothetical protein